MADIRQFSKAVREMANYRQMPTAKLVEYEQYFVGQLGSFGSDPRAQIYDLQCLAQIESLRAAISRRWLAEENKRQHQEVLGVGKKSLCWSRIAGGAGIVASVAGVAAVIVAVLSLVYQIYTSRVPPATSQQASQPSSSQSPTPTNALPQEISSTPTPSPEQVETAQPSVSPQESSGNPKD